MLKMSGKGFKMKGNERKKGILELLRERSFVSVEELSRLLYTSPSSIRRDLNELQEQGLVRRNYGGVMLFETKVAAPAVWRWDVQKAEKKLIAKQAAALLRDNTTVFLDSSTTAYYMVEHIAEREGITVITNNLRTAQSLVEQGVSTYCLGGHIMPSSSSMCDGYTEELLSSFHADMTFFSTFALSEDGVISDSTAEENAIRRQMLRQSDCGVFLCDSSKFGRRATHRLCSLEDVDICFFDKQPIIK